MFQRFFRREPKISEEDQAKLSEGVKKTRGSFFVRMAQVFGHHRR